MLPSNGADVRNERSPSDAAQMKAYRTSETLEATRKRALAGMLLPGEVLTFASRPHPIVYVGPAIVAFFFALAMLALSEVTLHPIVRGHHVSTSLASLPLGRVALLAAAGCTLVAFANLIKGASFAASFRLVASNRRVFLIRGVFGRSVVPLGNTAMGGARLQQGLLGRMLDFGTIVMAGCIIRDVRAPIAAYHALSAVANGVDGETWVPPIRQTLIP